MKNIIFKFHFILILLSSCQNNPPHIKEAEKFSNKISRKIENKYNLFCYGSGGAMMHNIEEIALSFVSFDQLSTDEVRVLFVNIMEQFLNEINAEENIRPYVETYPVPIEGFDLIIRFDDKLTNKFAKECFVALVYLTNGKIIYKARNKEDTRFILLHKEPYSEAYEKVHGRPWTGTSKFLTPS